MTRMDRLREERYSSPQGTVGWKIYVWNSSYVWNSVKRRTIEIDGCGDLKLLRRRPPTQRRTIVVWDSKTGGRQWIHTIFLVPVKQVGDCECTGCNLTLIHKSMKVKIIRYLILSSLEQNKYKERGYKSVNHLTCLTRGNLITPPNLYDPKSWLKRPFLLLLLLLYLVKPI